MCQKKKVTSAKKNKFNTMKGTWLIPTKNVKIIPIKRNKFINLLPV